MVADEVVQRRGECDVKAALALAAVARVGLGGQEGANQISLAEIEVHCNCTTPHATTTCTFDTATSLNDPPGLSTLDTGRLLHPQLYFVNMGESLEYDPDELGGNVTKPFKFVTGAFSGC